MADRISANCSADAPPAITVPAATLVHTVGKFDTRPSRSNVDQAGIMGLAIALIPSTAAVRDRHNTDGAREISLWFSSRKTPRISHRAAEETCAASRFT